VKKPKSGGSRERWGESQRPPRRKCSEKGPEKGGASHAERCHEDPGKGSAVRESGSKEDASEKGGSTDLWEADWGRVEQINPCGWN